MGGDRRLTVDRLRLRRMPPLVAAEGASRDDDRGDDWTDPPRVFCGTREHPSDSAAPAGVAASSAPAIASQTGEFHYERSVQPLPKLGSHVADLSRLLEENERRSRREQLTLIRVWEELRELGYAGGYDTVRRYARRWQRARGAQIAEAFVPLSYAPGEAYQFDWSHEVVELAGMTTVVKV